MPVYCQSSDATEARTMSHTHLFARPDMTPSRLA
jgi:hypothetical protein